jgi:hypothetical protein
VNVERWKCKKDESKKMQQKLHRQRVCRKSGWKNFIQEIGSGKNGRRENVRECMEIRVNKEKCRKMQENASRQSGMHLERAFRAKCAKN